MMITIFCVIILVIIILRVTSKKKGATQTNCSTDGNLSLDNNQGYWEGFKRRNPLQAKQVEMLIGRDMSRLDNRTAYQIVASLIRWSENANVPIGELKTNFLKETNSLLVQPGMSYDLFISKLKNEKLIEARRFGISPDFTVCNFMLEFIEEDRQKKAEMDITQRIGGSLGVMAEEMDTFASSVSETSEDLNLAPDISNLDREENKLFHLAEEGAKMLDNLTIGITNQIRLSKAGFAEARILCSTIVIDLTSNFKNEIDLDKQMDRYFLLLADPTMFDCDNVEDVIGFLNSRIAFYNKEVQKAINLNALQILQPNNALGRIFNTLYLHPETENPENLVPGEITPNDLVMFRGLFEKVVKHLQNKSRQIHSSATLTDGDKLQAEIEQSLMLLFPESKRAQITQDMVIVMTDVILEDIKSGKINSRTFDVLPSHIKSNFVSLTSKIQNYSRTNTDIDDIIKAAQNNVANKFD